MAYVLGFFAADGYIVNTKRGSHFWCIQITDRTLLESIKLTINSKHKISTRLRSGQESTIYRLQIGSKEMCEDLAVLGFFESKAKRMILPKVPASYFSNFVRGYFDGDGNVWSGRMHKDRERDFPALLTMFTSGSLGFLEALLSKLREAGLHGGSIYTSKQNYSRLQFSTKDSLKLYDFMYNQPYPKDLFLERKKSVFERYKRLRS